jgi:hypothetical protein
MAKSVNLDNSVEMEITCNKGDTFELLLEYDTDLTGHTFKMHVRDSKGALKLEFATGGNGITITDDVVRLYKTATAMSGIEAGLYKYDMDDMYPDLTVAKQFRGKFTVNPDQTP